MPTRNRNWTEMCKGYVKRVYDSYDKVKECADIQGEFLTLVENIDISDSAKKEYFKRLRGKITKGNPTLDIKILPKCPKEIFDKVMEEEKGRLKERCDRPIKVDSKN